MPYRRSFRRRNYRRYVRSTSTYRRRSRRGRRRYARRSFIVGTRL
jgi:hypothetical protein